MAHMNDNLSKGMMLGGTSIKSIKVGNTGNILHNLSQHMASCDWLIVILPSHGIHFHVSGRRLSTSCNVENCCELRG